MDEEQQSVRRRCGLGMAENQLENIELEDLEG